MSSFSVDGLVSGLDTTTLIRQLMQIEALPKQRLQVRVNETSSSITAYQELATSLKKLADAATALTEAKAFGGVVATVEGDSVSATARPGAPVAPFTVQVNALATATTFTSDVARRMDEVVVPGSTIDITKADGTLVSLQPASGTLQDVMSAINSAQGLGVKAVAVRVSDDTYRLQIVSTATGAGTGPTAISGLGDPLTTVWGADASYEVGGITATSRTNTVTDLVTGVDVTLRATGTSTVSLAPDTAATVSLVEGLVTAANDALALVRKQTSNEVGQRTGPLQSDGMVRALTGRIVQAVTDALGGQSAASIGLQSTRGGDLVLDKAVLESALAADPLAVQNLLAPAGGGGVVDRLKAVVTSATDAGTGFITSAVQGRERTKRDLEDQIVSWDRRLELRQQTLQRQFSGLEVQLGRLQSQSNWLSGQLAGLWANSAAANQ